MAEPFTIYKLTILNMLDKVDFPLTNTQISDFFLEQEYTDYFRVQQVLNDLADSGLIRTESTHSNTQYYITAAGRETLGFFRDKLTDAIEHDTIAYFEINKVLRQYEFYNTQGSVYLTEKTDMANLFRAIDALKRIPWFQASVRDLRAFRVEDWSNFTDFIKENK